MEFLISWSNLMLHSLTLPYLGASVSHCTFFWTGASGIFATRSEPFHLCCLWVILGVPKTGSRTFPLLCTELYRHNPFRTGSNSAVSFPGALTLQTSSHKLHHWLPQVLSAMAEMKLWKPVTYIPCYCFSVIYSTILSFYPFKCHQLNVSSGSRKSWIPIPTVDDTHLWFCLLFTSVDLSHIAALFNLRCHKWRIRSHFSSTNGPWATWFTSPQPNGRLVLEAQNGLATLRRPIHLTIFTAGETHTLTLLLSSHPFTEHVTYVNISGPYQVVEHMNASLNCSSDGTEVSYVWLKDSQLLETGERITFGDNNQTLILRDVWWNDTGNYACYGYNFFSNASASYWLNVICESSFTTVSGLKELWDQSMGGKAWDLERLGRFLHEAYGHFEPLSCCWGADRES